MKIFKISVCFILCALMLTSCGNSKNAEYFKELISDNATEEVMYLPKLLSGYDNPDEITVTAQKDTVTYLFRSSVESKNNLVYQYINVHLQMHADSQDIEKSIDSVIDNFADENSTVKAVKHEFDGKKYAISHEIRPDLDIVRLTVIFAVSDNVSAFYTLEIKDIEEINDKILDDICEDTEMIKL